MNIRVSGNVIRYRITNEELERLEQGATLLSRTDLPGGQVLVFELVRGEQATRFCFEGMAGQLIVSHSGLSELKNSLPSKEGISNRFELESGRSLEVSLEVDIKRTRK